MVRETLNRLKWTGRIAECEVIIVHRGAENNIKTVKGKNITEIKKSYFCYKNEKETLIPFHRVIEIREGDKIVWKKRKKILGD